MCPASEVFTQAEYRYTIGKVDLPAGVGCVKGEDARQRRRRTRWPTRSALLAAAALRAVLVPPARSVCLKQLKRWQLELRARQLLWFTAFFQPRGPWRTQHAPSRLSALGSFMASALVQEDEDEASAFTSYLEKYSVHVAKADFKFNAAHFVAYKGFRER